MFAALYVPASATTWSQSDFTITVPDEFVYTFDQNSSEEDPSWALAGIADPATRISNYQEINVLASFFTENGDTNIMVMTKETTSSQSIFQLKDLDEEDRQTFLDNLAEAQSDEVKLEKSYEEVNGLLFYRMRMDSSMEDSEVHGIICGTILNGYAVTFELYNGSKEITDEQVALLDSIINSFTVTNMLEKPETQPEDFVPALLMLGFLVLAVLLPIIYIPVRNRRDKKVKAKMAERLSQYRQQHPGDTITGEMRFVNSTECTKEAVHAFSVYQAYVKRIGAVIVGAAVCALILSVAFIMDMTWWLKLCVVGVTVYYIYRLISMPGTIEKVQMKVFQRGVSQVAHYIFYDDGFRVSGIQSGSVYPYFQITDIRRRGQYIYLYYGPENAYLIDQYGFEQGDFESFEKFIREKTAKIKK